MDETRWPMYLFAGRHGAPESGGFGWWLAPEVTAFLLEPTRSGQVPQDFFAPGSQGIANVDRYCPRPAVTTAAASAASNSRRLPTPKRRSQHRCELWSRCVFERVSGGRRSRLWNELIARYHYLGYRPLSGAQMRYLVGSADGRLLAALGFGACAWQIQPGDRYIGWNDRQRRAGLNRIVNNARLLILPCLQCGGLASRILSGILKPLRADWRMALGIRTGVAGNLRGNPALYRHFPPGGQVGSGSDRLWGGANWKSSTVKSLHSRISGFTHLHRDFRQILCAPA